MCPYDRSYAASFSMISLFAPADRPIQDSSQYPSKGCVLGQPQTIEISTCAHPDHRFYTWTFNGTALRPGIGGKDTAVISITEVTQDDIGLYTCNVSNAIGYTLVMVDLYPLSTNTHTDSLF